MVLKITTAVVFQRHARQSKLRLIKLQRCLILHSLSTEKFAGLILLMYNITLPVSLNNTI